MEDPPTAYFSTMTRGWTMADSVRVLRRIDREIDINQLNPDGNRYLTDVDVYREMLCRAIHRDIEFLRSCGALSSVGPDLTEHDREEVLFGQIFNEIYRSVMRGDMSLWLFYWSQEFESLTRNGGGLHEETMSKCLKTKRFDKEIGGRYEEVEMCVVCLDQLYQENDTIATLECGHEFHVDCIKRWLQKKNICPLCKARALSLGT